MALAAQSLSGPGRFLAVLALWAATCWCALPLGLTRTDRDALGRAARRLRLA